ncbi:MAG: HAMP domain-containing sensor histidine kinase [Myxococcaceae bacterium]
MPETLFEELKRYVGFDANDEAALRALHPIAKPEFVRISEVFYDRILKHDGARTALVGGESSVGRLKVTLQAWMEKLLQGPWDEAYYELRCRIGRLHVRIALPQHYMFGAMNVLHGELSDVIDGRIPTEQRADTRRALAKILDLEIAIMLHTYREDLLAQQARQERLSTFGQLLGSIGHELRNPLGVIETSLYILGGRIGADERAKKHVDRIGDQLKIANGIISNLLDMIRDRPLVRSRLALLEVVESAVATVIRPPGLTLTVQGLDTLQQVSGDAGQLRQVFLNLAQNAVHAAGDTGHVWINGKQLNGFVRIEVDDDGQGVDPATLRRLFEPLITTKEKGIGLGLALVRRIVERHEGTVFYEPRPGGGARFVVRLPEAPA